MKRRTTSRTGAKDRPTPEGAVTGVAVAAPAPTESVSDGWSRPHRMAFAVQSRLRREPGLDFESLVVRELPNGVCLEGVVFVDEKPHDIESVVKLVAGVDRVLNRLVVRGEVTG